MKQYTSSFTVNPRGFISKQERITLQFYFFNDYFSGLRQEWNLAYWEFIALYGCSPWDRRHFEIKFGAKHFIYQKLTTFP